MLYYISQHHLLTSVNPLYCSQWGQVNEFRLKMLTKTFWEQNQHSVLNETSFLEKKNKCSHYCIKSNWIVLSISQVICRETWKTTEVYKQSTLMVSVSFIYNQRASKFEKVSAVKDPANQQPKLNWQFLKYSKTSAFVVMHLWHHTCSNVNISFVTIPINIKWTSVHGNWMNVSPEILDYNPLLHNKCIYNAPELSFLTTIFSCIYQTLI